MKILAPGGVVYIFKPPVSAAGAGSAGNACPKPVSF